MRKGLHIAFLGLIVLLSACVTKRIPEGEYLLDKSGADFIIVLPDSLKSRIVSDSYTAEFSDSAGNTPKKVPYVIDTLDYLFNSGKYPGDFFRKDKNLSRAGKKAADHTSKENLDPYDIDDIIKQKPNRTIFGFIKFHLWVYTILDPDKVAARAEKKYAKKINKNIHRLEKDIERNQRRLLKGKSPKEPRKPKPYRRTFGQWLLNVVGEAPVLLDSAKTCTTTEQIETYLLKHGYFNAAVRDSTIYHRRKAKAAVYYIIKPEAPYRIRKVERYAPDPQMQRYINSALKNDSIIKSGAVLNVDLLEKERKRIESYLANRGYYTFKRDYIFYKLDSTVYKYDTTRTLQSDSTYFLKVDSTRIPNVVDITMKITDVQRHISHDSIVTESHKIHYIRNVNVITDYNLAMGENVYNYDTITLRGILYAYREKLKIRPYTLSERIFIKPGYKYRADEVEATYKQISNLGVFRAINIKFNTVSSDSTSTYLDCTIMLTSSKRQSYSIEGNGTNKAGNLGISGALVYRHKNLFKGAERLSISLAGGLEAQQLIANQDSTVVGGGDLNPLNSFNTIEFGPVVSIDFPKIIFLDKMLFRKWVHTGTGVKTSYNFQRRPDFTRSIQEASIFFEGRPAPKHNFRLSVFSLNSLKISNQSAEFLARLADLNDPVLYASFNDHIISSSAFNYTYNDQNPNKQLDNVIYYSSNLEWAGNTLRLFADNLGLDYNPVNNSYSLFGIRFAQYVRLTQEFRFYKRHNEGSESVFRLYGGLGLPGQNLHDALPFERSFFAGGSNGIRAWRARTLGPGHYLDSTFTERFDKIGDIHLEGNFEYRFDFLDFIEGALFVDAGNIWLMNPSNSRPGGDFSTEFWKDIAIGGGIGFRFDLDFFIVRLDFATKLRDPALPVGEKWFFEEHTTHDALRADQNLQPYRGGINVNFGIGYPF